MTRHLLKGRRTVRQHHALPALRAIGMPATRMFSGQGVSRLRGASSGRSLPATLKAFLRNFHAVHPSIAWGKSV